MATTKVPVPFAQYQHTLKTLAQYREWRKAKTGHPVRPLDGEVEEMFDSIDELLTYIGEQYGYGT